MKRYIEVLEDHTDIVMLNSAGVFRYWAETTTPDIDGNGHIKFRHQCLRREGSHNTYYSQTGNIINLKVKNGKVPVFQREIIVMILGD